VACWLSAALLSGCAYVPSMPSLPPLLGGGERTSSRVVLLPVADEEPGSLEVFAQQRVQRISRPYETASVNADGTIGLEQGSAAAARSAHPVLLSMAVPKLPPVVVPPPPPPPPPPPAPPSSSVILLPQPDGSPSAVVVRTPQGTQAVSRPYELANVGQAGELSLGQTSAEAVQRNYPDLINLHPRAPERFQLQFVTGTAQLSANSLIQLNNALARARARAGGEILITGHTDRQGATDLNDRLSLQRAQAMRDLLIARGFPAERIEAIGRGEREPLVPTEDGVAEPRNRRAELLVR
jgi:outer membrane protein OmpA-like peptidoglycan-associated protein